MFRHANTFTVICAVMSSHCACLFLLVLSGCNIDMFGKSELAPILVIVSPTEGDVFQSSDTITFIGTVQDENLNTVHAEWDIDGTVYPANVGTTGRVGLSVSLLVGHHDVLLVARDEDNNLAQVGIGLEVVALDSDGDGVPDEMDCAPEDAGYSTNQSWFYDDDGDGFGEPSVFVEACVPAVGFVLDGTDCDDSDTNIHPNAAEICDGVDNNCDSRADEAGAYGEQDWFFDADGDSFGDPNNHYYGCLSGSGWIGQGGDCNDSNPMANSGAIEICDGIDNDCDTLSDEAGAVGEYTWFYDGDADGYGDAALGILVSCEVLSGYSLNDGDCDDTDAAYHPFVAEWCSDPDFNCDGAPGTPQMYMDYDQDGRGTNVPVSVIGDPCLEVVGASFYPDDCDDNDATVYPGAIEYCDNKDNNCDGAVDELDLNRPPTAWFDADGDGYGGTVYNPSCSVLNGYISVAGDCDDSRADVSPSGVEVCDANNTDENCNGLADDADAVDVRTQSSWYADRDGDTFGDMRDQLLACDMPAQRVSDRSDCDDTRPDINPNGLEVCDAQNADEDCDGLSDDSDASATGQSLWYEDADGDRYGSTTSLLRCDAPVGYEAVTGDCNDREAGVNPGVLSDVCDAVDSDCDGFEDEDAIPDSYDLSAPNGSWAGASALGYGSRTISNLTITQSDYNGATGYYEDWYSFYGDDDGAWINVNMSVSVVGGQGLVAELYNDLRPNKIIPGLTFQGINKAPDEGYFHLRIYNTSYQTYQCNVPYSITITFN